MQISLELKKNFLIFLHSSKLIIKLVLIDQISKWYFINFLKQKPTLSASITPFLDATYAWNYGISFGMFKDYHQYSNILFIFLNSLITIYLWRIIFKFKSIISFIGYSFIIGGAVGNIIDRIYRGAVFDFIHFHYGDYSFPIFNLADAFISCGAALLIYDHYKSKKPVEQNLKTNYDALEDEAEKIRKISDNDDLGVK
jgi:signal peptidase II